MAVDERDAFTPPQIAKRWGSSPEQVIGLILAGELGAFNIARKGASRPRWRISREHLADFERRRSAVVTPKPKRKRRPAGLVKEYF